MSNHSHTALFSFLSRISRACSPLPRGKIGVLLNHLTGQYAKNPIVQFQARNGLTYIADLRSYTENYTPWTGEYEGKTIDAIRAIVPAHMNVCDIGANVGYWSLNLAQMITDNNRVYAFEPVASNFARIKEHITVNQCETKIIPFNIGLSDSESQATFVINDHDTVSHAQTFNATVQPDPSGDITLTTFDSLCDTHGISSVGFVKIDVEGFEIKALRGATQLRAMRPIVYGEFTPEDIEKAGDNPQELFSLFPDYTVFQEVKAGVFSPLIGTHYTRDILLVPNEKVSEILPLLPQASER